MDDFAVDLDKVLDDFELSEGGDGSVTHPSLSSLDLDVSRVPFSKPSLHCDNPNNPDLLYTLAGEPLEKLDLSQADFAPSKAEFKPELISDFRPVSSAPSEDSLPPTLSLDLNVPLQLQQNGHAEPPGGSQRSNLDCPPGGHQRLVQATIESQAHLLNESFGDPSHNSLQTVSDVHSTPAVTSNSNHEPQPAVDPQDLPPCLIRHPAHTGMDTYPTSHTTLSMLPTVSNSDSLPISPCSTLSDGGPENQSDSGVSVTTSDQSEAPGLSAAGTTGSPSMAAPTSGGVDGAGQPELSAATMGSGTHSEPASLPGVGAEATGAVPMNLPTLAMDSSACDNPPPQSQASHAECLQQSAEPIAMDTADPTAPDGTSPAMDVSCHQAPVGFGEEECLSDSEIMAYLSDMTEGSMCPAETTLSGSLQTSAGQIEAARSDPTTVVLEDNNVICLESCPGQAESSSDDPMEAFVVTEQLPVDVHQEQSQVDEQPQSLMVAMEVKEESEPEQYTPKAPLPGGFPVSQSAPCEPLIPSRPGGLMLASPLSPSSVMSSPSTPGERRGSGSSNTSVERFLAPALVIPGIATPMEDAGFAKVPGYIPSAGLGEVTEVEEPNEELEHDTRTTQPPFPEVFPSSDAEAVQIIDAPPSSCPTDNVSTGAPDSLAPVQSPVHSGARPKDPAVLRRNRPTSLLGLSTPELPTEVPMSGQDSPEGEYLVPPNHLTTMSVPPAPSPHHNPPHGLPIPQPEEARTEVYDPTDAVDSTDHASLPDIPGLTSPTRLAPDALESNLSAAEGPGKQRRPNSLNLSLPADPRVDSTAGSTPYMLSSDDSTPLGITGNPIMGLVSPPGSSSAGPMEAANMPLAVTHLGKVAPHWVPDGEAPNCMQCEARFTFTKRRHHCRACGKVFCSACCSLRCKLEYKEGKEARVCSKCYQDIVRAQAYERVHSGSLGPVDPPRSPNPNNPAEYCSTIPPLQQAQAGMPPPTVMVPSGVLRKQGSQRNREPKQVTFSDGIRPGGDLTELDGSSESRLPLRKHQRTAKKVDTATSATEASGPEMEAPAAKKRTIAAAETTTMKCLIPEYGLPPIVVPIGTEADYRIEDSSEPEKIMPKIKDMDDPTPVMFAINKNLFVLVKLVNLDCCVNRLCWCFTTRGMCTVGQDEVVIVLECLPDEEAIPRDIFCHLNSVYEQASKGNTVSHLGHTIFGQSFLGSREHCGFLYLQPSFQCLQKLLLPSPPYVVGILLQKWETPWAKVFPIRLMLRLGAEYRYYPCPLISVRFRKPVFGEIGHTIMNLLADFHHFQYMLPQIRGVHIHMQDKQTYIRFPRNRYDDVMKVVSNSNEHVMALGANFSQDADSHLVCIQNEDGNYQTQAINIQNKPRKITGASFVVFNGALKSSSGLRAKSSIVEDGLMVQITPDSMLALKSALREMQDYTISCGLVDCTDPEEQVFVQWIDDDHNVNIGVTSPIDGLAMDGIESIHIHSATDYIGSQRAVRWTEVFFIHTEEGGNTRIEPVDLSRLAEQLASACCLALTPHLDALKEAGLTKVGLRCTIDTENVCYDIGSNGEKLPPHYMNDLDNELIPVIHSAASHSQDGPVILELLFHVIE